GGTDDPAAPMIRLVVPLLVCLAALAGPALSGAAGAAQDAEPARDRVPHGRLFPPEDLGLLEGPDRDAWQQPERIMDLLRIADGAAVADIGAGGGWFTVRLARRVGPNGLVYAEDIQPQMLESINRRVRREGLANVRTIHGTPTDPLLPSPVDAVLIVDVYAAVAVEDRIPLLRNLLPLLAPGGRVGIVDFKLDGGGPGPPLAERVEPEAVVRDARAAGLRLREREDLRYQYVLVFVAAAAR
ncbi:MAG: methyltransferase domain-containing protein, partial [Acidobacteria bacterium]|nr:methyltransferase domain-containing protein [Acidobacteriota bacterium]